MAESLGNFVAVLHASVSIFVVGGFVMIAIGKIKGWSWTENFKFRATHLSILLFIAIRLSIGAPCPLSVWEDSLRGKNNNSSLAHALAFRGVEAGHFRMGVQTLFAATALMCLHSGIFRKSIRVRGLPPTPSPRPQILNSRAEVG